MFEVVGLCMACAHMKPLGLYKSTDSNRGDPAEGLCFECRDAAEHVRGPCDCRCRCAIERGRGIINHDTPKP